jgi:DNA-3-methyladenine glycosylase
MQSPARTRARRRGSRATAPGNPAPGPAPGWAHSLPPGLAPLPRAFYDRDTQAVARDLLGTFLVHQLPAGLRIGRIVEVEAYLGPQDRAAHSARGLTPRTAVMFGPPGHAYVYLVYGLHCCMNVVTEQEGHAAAVLIRALEPVSGLTGSARGPGLLSRAMGIDRTRNGADLCTGPLWISATEGPAPAPIVRRPRIGVDYAGAWARRLLRFYLRGNPFISRP